MVFGISGRIPLRNRIIGAGRVVVILILVFALLGLPQGSALAQGSWGEDFDSYALGLQLHGIGGWKGWDNNVAYGALVSNTQSRSSPHSVSITGNSDLVHEYSGHTSGQWVYTAWQYIPASYSGEGYFILLNTYNDGGAKNWSVQVHFRSSTNLVISDFEGSTLPLVRGRWVELRVEINLDTDQQTFYYDNQLLYTKSWRNGVSGGGQAAIEAVDLYANSSTPIYYDDISLKSASATTLSSAANPSEYGSDALLTATVTSLSTLAVTPTGTVDFYEGAAFLGSSALDGSGQANIAISGLGLGAYTITANYSGDVNYTGSSDTLVQNVTDTTPPTVGSLNTVQDTGDGILSPGESTNVDITQLLVTFSEGVLDPAGNSDPDDVTNPSNYSLILDPYSAAIPISIDSVFYDAGSRTAAINFNSGLPLDPGTYQFSVHGTPSIQDLQGNPLDGDGDGIGGDDFALDFRILPDQLPETGFPPGRQSPLPDQPCSTSYTELNLRLIIPSIDQDLAIIGVPLTADGWQIDWLGITAGYLEGTAFPTWEGNTVLTGHAYLQSGLPGPFVNLGQLKYGDQIQIQAWGMTHNYAVVETRILDPGAPQAFAHSEQDILTLVTCRGYNEAAGTYSYRTMVRAVLVSVTD